MAICCCSLANTSACMYCRNNAVYDVELYRFRRYLRLLARLDAEDEGQWITMNGSHVHINENGDIDVGNDHLVFEIEMKSRGRGGAPSPETRLFADRHGLKTDEQVQSIGVCIDRVNPKGFTQNCTHCAACYELNRRGIKCTAKNIANASPSYVASLFLNADWTPSNDVESDLNGLPDGARGIIYGNWTGGRYGHVFNFEKIGGVTYLVDAQDPNADTTNYLSMLNPETTCYARLDNVALIDGVVKAVE